MSPISFSTPNYNVLILPKAVRPGKLTNGVNNPDITDSPDELDVPTITHSQDPAVTSVIAEGDNVITSINCPGSTAGVVSISAVFGGNTLSGIPGAPAMITAGTMMGVFAVAGGMLLAA